MRVLLDENLPHDLVRALEGHEVSTVRGLGWAGLRNGDLLQQAHTPPHGSRHCAPRRHLMLSCSSADPIAVESWSIKLGHEPPVVGGAGWA